MKYATRILLYVLGVLLLGALLAPPLFWLGQLLIARNIVPSLARYDFESYFDRAVLIAALVLLWPLFRSVHIRSWRDLALERNPFAGRDLAAGLAFAAIPLLCCGVALVVLPYYSLRSHFLWSKMGTVLIASSVVPFLEELLFRGFVLGVLLRSCSRAVAVLMTSGLFAIVHFMKAPDVATPASAVTWSTGFVSIGRAFSQFGNPLLLLGGFLTLFAIACILADARLQTRSLWLPIGLHAGWIFANGLFNRAAHRDASQLPWIGSNLLVGLVPLGVALASWVLVRGWIEITRAERNPAGNAGPL